MNAEIREALRKERAEITQILESFLPAPPECCDHNCANSDAHELEEIIREIKRRDCTQDGHVRGVETNQITGLERCRHCSEPIIIKKAK